MTTAYARAQYQEAQVQTSPERLVVMLYDGAILALEQAIQGIRTEDSNRQMQGVAKAQQILCHLSATLDFDAGPIAAELQTLYLHFLKRLVLAHAYNDADDIEAIVEMLVELRDAWADAEANVARERANALTGIAA